MIALMLAAFAMQAGDPCHAVNPEVARPPACPAWRAIDNEGDGRMFVDPASVRRSADGFDVAIRIVFPSDRPDRGRSGISLLRFACRPMTYTLVRLTVYNAAGSQLSDGPVDDAVPSLLLDGSPLGGLMNEFCPAIDAAERRERLAALQRAAGEWRSVSRDNEGELFFDTVPAGRTGETVTVRTLMRFNAVTSDGVRSHITLLRLNCARRTGSVQYMTVFRDDGSPMIDTAVTGESAAEHPAVGGPSLVMLGQFCPG